MAQKNVRVIGIIVLITFVIYLTYSHYSMKYFDYLQSINGVVSSIGGEKVNENNFKDRTYKRIIAPACGINATVDHEKLYFINNNTLAVEKTLIPIGNFFYLKHLLRIQNGKVDTQKYILKNDTLFNMKSEFSEGKKHTEFLTFRIENDSLKVTLPNVLLNKH